MADYTITTNRGDTLTITITCKTAAGVAVDITGWTFFFTLKNLIDDLDASAVYKSTWTTHTTPASGITAVTMTAAETDALAGDYLYDIQYKDTSGNVKTIIPSSRIVFNKDVTRRVTA